MKRHVCAVSGVDRHSFADPPPNDRAICVERRRKLVFGQDAILDAFGQLCSVQAPSDVGCSGHGIHPRLAGKTGCVAVRVVPNLRL